MNSKVQELKNWFGSLSKSDKEAVLRALYGDILEHRGMYVGPPPGVVNVNEGIYVGPAPTPSASSCPKCGKAY